MIYNVLYKTLVIGVLFLFVGVAVVPCFSVVSGSFNEEVVNSYGAIDNLDEKTVTCYVFDKKGNSQCEVTLSSGDYERFFSLFEELNHIITYEPFSSEAEVLKSDLVDMVDGLGLIPDGFSREDIDRLMNPSIDRRRPLLSLIFNPVINERGYSFFCNFATFGEGSQFPVIILPRLIPIIQLPIPRVVMHWNANTGITSCGGLLSGEGFIAEGAQQGTALGFWGIGFSVFLPPVMGFGFIGYALFATATAEAIHPWPPNQAPVVYGEEPSGGTWDVPLSLSELSFHISDADGDRMSYWVTSDPDIGSGQGVNKNDGVYSIPVSGLEYDKFYSWTVRVSDGHQTVEKQFGFITEVGPPFDPFDEGWQYRKKITIDHDMVDGDLSDFPVLVSLFDSDLASKAQVDGDDILFMEGSGVAKKLYHEIERYDGSSGELVTWVNIPSLSSTVDTVLYMYYGNSSCDSQNYLMRVWDSDYCGVWHLDDFKDSTLNGNDGENHGTDEITGKIGSAKDFVSSNSEYIDLGDMTEPCDGAIGTATFEMWIKPDTLIDGKLLTKHNSKVEPDKKTYMLEVLTDGNIKFVFWSGTWYSSKKKIIVTTDDAHVSIGIWQHIVAVADAASRDVKIYYNGDEKPSTTIIEGEPVPYFSDISWSENLGRNRGSSLDRYYDGCMDEVRISKICKNVNWISTEYNNQNDPSSFSRVGPEETAP